MSEHQRVLDEHDAVLERYRNRFQEHDTWIRENVRGNESGRGGAVQQHSRGSHNDNSRTTTATKLSYSPGGAGTAQRYNPPPREESSPAQGYTMASPGSRGSGGIDVVQRLAHWSDRKQEKIKLKVQEKTIGERDGCSFTPKLTHRTDTARSTQRSSRAQPTTYLKGVDGHKGRLEKAREMREEAKKMTLCDGSHWKPETTVFQEFQLGVRGDRPNKSLSKPVNAPVRSPLRADEDALNLVARDMSTERDDWIESAAEVSNLPPRGMFSERTSVAIADKLRENSAVDRQ